LRSENKVLMIANERLLNETETLQDQNYLLKQDIEILQSDNDELKTDNDVLRDENEQLNVQVGILTTDNTRLTKENDELEKDNDELRQDNEQLNVDNGILQSDNDRLKKENDGLETDNEDLTNDLDTCENSIDDYFKVSAVRGIFVKIGDNGCNYCEMRVKIYNKDGGYCSTGSIDSAANDWQPHTTYAYWYGSIGDCQKWQATRGVSKINVQHSGMGGVTIEEWRIFTDSGEYYCPGRFFDNSDSADATCVRGN